MRLHKNYSMKRAGEAGSQPRAQGRNAPSVPPGLWCSGTTHRPPLTLADESLACAS
ncbi:hypothetical protein RSc0956 [Ralstonia pseudosolanacearum GMI1000]|uniref:Uncharacterized protein n=1 Tax=Ralstonia nicotianae (strain ATCC BAA-1114 / GMI1000) TaxID=267608 RepID=Q8Y0T7_RALN1|nr:hypothetical protein RSc0956 [Ralstonia pseudosolanacearum GMI1000]